ncbi:hypothetical protein CIB84_013456 [Bambusicola thoracicus]|uniref:Uncharacterized protein n=1 Tax=Bambusicola thoracicus TaxID=9083 RepID=A0A2P4SFE6_BAMTH|nr:hypothetical protein CIB84_013456 [Bambusicola thoracicus]
MSPQGRQDPSTSCETAASTPALILPSSKAPTSPPFPFPSLVLSQVLSSLLHQVLRKRAGHGLPSLELLCRGSGMSPVEGPQLPGPQTSQGCEDPVSLPLARRGSPSSEPSRRLAWSLHFLVILPLTRQGSHVSPSLLFLSTIPPQGDRRNKKMENQALIQTGRTAELHQEDLVQMLCLDCSFKTGLSTT